VGVEQRLGRGQGVRHRLLEHHVDASLDGVDGDGHVLVVRGADVHHVRLERLQ
jgi:hypothetical protein